MPVSGGVNFQNVNPVYAPLLCHERRHNDAGIFFLPLYPREYRINIVFPWPCRKYRRKNGRRRIKKPDTRHIIRTFERQFLRQKGINAIRRIGIRINKIRNRLTVISIDRPHQECQFVQRLNQSFSNWWFLVGKRGKKKGNEERGKRGMRDRKMQLRRQ